MGHGMHHPRRLLPLLFVLHAVTACINVPDIEPPPGENEVDAGTTPDAGSDVPESLTLLTSFPAGGSTQVATGTQFTLTFSSPLDTGSLRVEVTPQVSFRPIEWGNRGTVATLRPSAALEQNTTYTVTVDAKALSGPSLTGTRSFSFSTTGPAPDTLPPTLLSTTPSHAAVGVPRDTLIEILFSEPMDRDSVQTAFAITSPAGLNSGSFTWNETSTVVTYSLPSRPDHGTSITWQVSTFAKDTAGNPLEDTEQREFRIVRQSSAMLPLLYSASGTVTADSSGRHYRPFNLYDLERIGDNSAHQSSRLFLSFKLDALPPELIRINRSTVRWWLSSQTGQPFEKLGPLLMESVDVGESLPQSIIEETEYPELAAAYDAIPLAPALSIGAADTGTPGVFDVTPFVSQDWASRMDRNHRSQLRLRFTQETNYDGVTDELRSSVSSHATLAELEVVYEHP
ncbi:Ig-like domain-containing protein [Myxococcus hansupus]|nr:Ig-like domain-containing protein [Myxococcus hansupus]